METDTPEEIVVEVLDSSEVPESELLYFEEAQIQQVEDIVIDDQNERKEVLIQKYVNGEVPFNDFYNSFDDDEEDDTEIWEIQDIKQNIKSEIPSTSSGIYNSSSIKNSSSVKYENDDDDNHQEQQKIKKNEQEQTLQETERPKEITKRIHRKRSILTAALQGLMGEANLCFVRGQIAMAEKICLEIIRQNPLASEPFFTLAQIYENQDEDKYLEFLTIAAHLDPTNRDQWLRIAEINIEKNKLTQARNCYSKAIRFFPKDYEIRIMKAKLLKKMGEERDAMYTLMKTLTLLPSEKYEYCLKTAKECASYFHKQQKMQFALEAMNNAYKVAKDHFTHEDINLYLELLLINKLYLTVLFVLKHFEHIAYITEKNENNDTIIVGCSFSDLMLPEYRVKASVSLVHLKAFHLIEYITQNIFEFVSIEENIEGIIDVAEAMMFEGKYFDALKFLENVLNDNININIPPYMWLRHAECHCALGNINDAIKSYQTVVELAPFCYDAKFALSALLKKQGKHKEATKALEQDLDNETFDPKVLHEYCLMLKSINEIDQYIEGGYILLARNSLKFRTREEMLQASSGANYYKSSTIKLIVESRLDCGITSPSTSGSGTGSSGAVVKKDDEISETKNNALILSIDDEYNLFKDILKECYKRKKYSQMQKLCFAMITSKKFRTKFIELEKLIIITSFYNDDTLISFMFLREILSRNTKCKIYWNLANLLIQKYDSVRYYRYFKRLLGRIATESYYKIFLANYHLSAGSYKYALNLYVTIFKDTNDPLLALCITIVFSQMSTQKNSLKKQTAAAQAIAFARKYHELRIIENSSNITEQEIYYNLGRIYHHAGLPHLAIKYYEKALNINNKFINEHENILGLREEIAFNLHLIYKTSGNYDMARKCLYKYIIV